MSFGDLQFMRFEADFTRDAEREAAGRERRPRRLADVGYDGGGCPAAA